MPRRPHFLERHGEISTSAVAFYFYRGAIFFNFFLFLWISWGWNQDRWSTYLRLFPSCPLPLCQSGQCESWCEAIGVKMRFICKFIFVANQTHFHEKSLAPGLVLKPRQNTTRKCPFGDSMIGWQQDSNGPEGKSRSFQTPLRSISQDGACFENMERIWGFCSSISFETKPLLEVSTLDIRSLLFYLLSTDCFVGINRSTYLFNLIFMMFFDLFLMSVSNLS